MPDISGFDFDPTTIEPQRPMEPVPAGPHSVVITETELRETKAGNGTYLQITMEIVGGEHAGRRLWDNINLRHPNEQAVEIGRRRLSTICRILGIDRLPNTEMLHGKALVAIVAHKLYEGSMRAEVKGYSASAAPAAPKRIESAAAPVKSPPWKKGG